MGWLSGWAYRRPIRINNTGNPNNLTYYQVLVTVDTAFLIAQGKMRSDCGDIRFTDSDGVTLLPYWIESGINTSTTKIWVKVPAIPASSIYTIYMYYGNSSALSQSDGTKVFDFFDDFEDGDVSDWVIFSGNGTSSASTAVVKQGKYSHYLDAGTQDLQAEKTLPSPISLPVILEVWVYLSNPYNSHWIIDSANKNVIVRYRADDAGSYKPRVIDSAGTTHTNLGVDNFDLNYWHLAIYYFTSDGIRFRWLYNGTKDEGTYGPYPGLSNIAKIRFAAENNANGVGYQDVVRIRKYASPEPTTTVDPEEVAPAPAVFTPIDDLKKRLIFTTTPSFLSLSGSGSINILSPSADTKKLTVRNWWLITNATGGKITLASPSKLFGSLLAKKQKKTGQEDIWTTLGMGEPILLYYQGITPDSKVLVLVSWRED